MFNDKAADCSVHLSSEHLLNTSSVSSTLVFVSLRIDLIWTVLDPSGKVKQFNKTVLIKKTF